MEAVLQILWESILADLPVMLLPFVAHEPIIPAATAFWLAFITCLPHKLNRRMYWFQDPENLYDVDFTLSWGLIVLVTSKQKAR